MIELDPKQLALQVHRDFETCLEHSYRLGFRRGLGTGVAIVGLVVAIARGLGWI